MVVRIAEGSAMKTLFLVGCAALFLATGAAHAQIVFKQHSTPHGLRDMEKPS